jgi:hypothetical protein
MDAKTMNIPQHILEAIGKGECTLFLGAGASNLAGAPSGEELGELIAKEFLSGTGEESPASLTKDWGLNLASAASLACAQPYADRGEIEKFVQNNLSSVVPSPDHLKIPWFRWRAIVTTNYDRLIESAYERETRAVQEFAPVLEEEELPSIGTTSSDSVPLLKPHGCMSRMGSMSLSLEDIYQARQVRRLLFTYIEILHLLGPVIYIGYSFKDIHILDMIYDLTSRLGGYRKPIMFVTLQHDPERAEKERNWIQGPLKGNYFAGGFEQFMDALTAHVTPAIVPAMIVGQMAPCQAKTFPSGVDWAQVSDKASYTTEQGSRGAWAYWLTYSIKHRDGYAGVIFERKNSVDISRYGKMTIELNIPKCLRKDQHLEVKLENRGENQVFLLNVQPLKGKGWQRVSIKLHKKNLPIIRRVRRLVLADNGRRAKIGYEYKIGLRKIKFELGGKITR